MSKQEELDRACAERRFRIFYLPDEDLLGCLQGNTAIEIDAPKPYRVVGTINDFGRAAVRVASPHFEPVERWQQIPEEILDACMYEAETKTAASSDTSHHQ